MMKTKSKVASAKKSPGGVLETVKTVVYAVLIAVVVRTVAYEPFNIPSGSMVPTLAGRRLPVRLEILLRLQPVFAAVRAAAVFRADLPAVLAPAAARRRRRLQAADRHLDRLHQAHRRAARRPPADAPRRALHQRPAGAAPRDKAYRNDEAGRPIVLQQYIESLPRGPGEAAGRALHHQVRATTGRSTTRRSTRCRRAIISGWATTATTRRTAASCRLSATSRPRTWSAGRNSCSSRPTARRAGGKSGNGRSRSAMAACSRALY